MKNKNEKIFRNKSKNKILMSDEKRKKKKIIKL